MLSDDIATFRRRMQEARECGHLSGAALDRALDDLDVFAVRAREIERRAAPVDAIDVNDGRAR